MSLTLQSCFFDQTGYQRSANGYIVLYLPWEKKNRNFLKTETNCCVSNHRVISQLTCDGLVRSNLKLTCQPINRRHLFLMINLSLCTHYSGWMSCHAWFYFYGLRRAVTLSHGAPTFEIAWAGVPAAHLILRPWAQYIYNKTWFHTCIATRVDW